MNIDINNYEEYFLLYADNELSASEKNIVEDFVSQHSELEEELLMFKQSVVKPDNNCVLEDKKSLFKEQHKFINHDNYHEIFILYNDNELNDWERQQTETFLLQNTRLRSELMLLQNTKLVPDGTIDFPWKQLLYKQEEKGKVIPVKWWRNVAAAIIATTGLWFGVTYLKNDKEKLPVAVKNNSIKKIKRIAPLIVNEKLNEPEKNIVAENNRSKNVSVKKTVVKNIAGKLSKIKHTPDVELVKKQQPIIVREPAIKNKNIETPENENQGIAVKKVQEPNDIKLTEKIDPVNEPNYDLKNIDIAVNDKNELPDDYALTASYTPDDDENSNNYVFYNITKEEFNKTKLGGFLRKVKRTVERKSPFNNSKDDNESSFKKPSKNL